MGLIKEAKEIDLSTKSKPWTKQELADFRKLIQEIKAKNLKLKEPAQQTKSKQKRSV